MAPLSDFCIYASSAPALRIFLTVTPGTPPHPMNTTTDSALLTVERLMVGLVRVAAGTGVPAGEPATLRAAQTLPLTAVLAISPQYQPAAKWEPRWREWTQKLPETLTAPLPQGPYLCLMHGLQDDAAQATLFPPQKGCDHVLFAQQAHATLAPHLKARGLVEGLIDAALSQDRRRLLRILQGAGGKRRQLPR